MHLGNYQLASFGIHLFTIRTTQLGLLDVVVTVAGFIENRVKTYFCMTTSW